MCVCVCVWGGGGGGVVLQPPIFTFRIFRSSTYSVYASGFSVTRIILLVGVPDEVAPFSISQVVAEPFGDHQTGYGRNS